MLHVLGRQVFKGAHILRGSMQSTAANAGASAAAQHPELVSSFKQC